MANRLAGSTSPYLRQHADNPIDWQPWSDAAFGEARQRGVPVLLSVGYAACHWCHVMAHESFSDPEIAGYVNEHFVAIKVDREERPDVDAVYMEATQAMTGQGGWPMTCFLTAEGDPFHCGTYYPARPHGGMPSFTQLLRAVVRAWSEDGERVRDAARSITRRLSSVSRVALSRFGFLACMSWTGSGNRSSGTGRAESCWRRKAVAMRSGLALASSSATKAASASSGSTAARTVSRIWAR